MMVLLTHGLRTCARLRTLRSSSDVDLTHKCGVNRNGQRSMVFYIMGWTHNSVMLSSLDHVELWHHTM